jgi:hypothetical protein
LVHVRSFEGWRSATILEGKGNSYFCTRTFKSLPIQ